MAAASWGPIQKRKMFCDSFFDSVTCENYMYGISIEMSSHFEHGVQFIRKLVGLRICLSILLDSAICVIHFPVIVNLNF